MKLQVKLKTVYSKYNEISHISLSQILLLVIQILQEKCMLLKKVLELNI